MAQVAVALPLLVARAGDDDPTVLDSAAETTSTTVQLTTAPPTVAGVTVTVEPPPTTVAATTTTARPTTTSSPCRNSQDPRCGGFRWDPAPSANDPADAAMTYAPASPRAGEAVAFVLRATDPDAPDVRFWSGPCVTPNPGGACPTAPAPPSCDPHGPWSPPPQRPLDRTERYTIVFPDPGTYRVEFTVQTQSHACPKLDPYGSTDTVALEVVVRP